MSTKIRLTRMGKKKSPFYRIIVADSRKARDGQYLDQIGTYAPISKDQDRLKINSEKAKSWIAKGAEPTLVVKNLFTKNKIFEESIPSETKIRRKNKRKNRLHPIKDRIKKEKPTPPKDKKPAESEEQPSPVAENEQIEKEQTQESATEIRTEEAAIKKGSETEEGSASESADKEEIENKTESAKVEAKAEDVENKKSEN